jgi:hypothetical protein
LYADVLGQSAVIDTMIAKLHHKVKAELRVQQQLLEILGSLDMVCRANLCAARFSASD